MLPVILAIAFFTRQVNAVTPSCHNGCNCFSEFVTCSDLKSLKGISLPLNTATLVLRNMQLETIPRDAFKSLNTLTVLELQNNTIRSIAEGAFSGLENMDTVMIVLNTIDIINRKAFSGMRNITHMTFSRNDIGSVRRDAFSNLTSIKEITFQSNNFTSIRRHAFHHLRTTKFFQFYLNRVKGTVEADSFSDIDNFKTVNIYLNHFSTLECRTLDNLVLSAQKISIYSNKFKCHCKLAWMLSRISMKSYLSSNWCVTNRLSKQLILSTATIEDLHCASASPTSKQRGCPNDKTKMSWSMATSSRKPTLPTLKDTTQRKLVTSVVRQTTLVPSLITTMSTFTERDIPSYHIKTTMTSPTPRTFSYTSITKLDTSPMSTPKTTSYTSIIKMDTTQTISTPKTSSYISITNMDTSSISSTHKTSLYASIVTDRFLTSLKSKQLQTSSVTRATETNDTPLTSTTSTSSITTATKMHTSMTSQMSKTSFISNPQINTHTTSSISKTSDTTKLAPTFSHTASSMNITSKSTSLSGLNQTTSVINSTFLAANQQDLSSTVRAAPNSISDVQTTTTTQNFGKHDLSTKSSVKFSYRHTVIVSAGHVIVADAGSLSVVLYLTLTAIIC